MPSRLGLKAILIAGLLLPQISLAKSNSFQNVLESIGANNFQQCLGQLESKKNLSSSDESLKSYYLGICNARLGNFDKATSFFTMAIKKKVKSQDVWYEIGQSLYAQSDLDRARKAFERSVRENFKVDVSNYYVAHISNVLEDKKTAKKHFMEVFNSKSADTSMKQASLLQYTNLYLEDASTKDDPREWVEKTILPLYEKIIALGETGEAATDAKTKLREVKAKYRLDPDLFVNGRPIPKKRYVVQLTQKATYDNNVTLSTDLPSKQASQKDSYIFKSTIESNYSLFYKQKHGFNPGFVYNWTRHSDRDSSTVFANDGWDYTLFLRNKVEHSIEDKPATFGYSLEYDYSKKDRDAKHENLFYSRGLSFSASESWSLFSFGTTGVTLKYKTSTGYIASTDNNTTTLTLLQTLVRKNSDLMLFLMVYTQSRLPSASSSDTDSILFNFNYIIPEVMPRFILNMGMAVTLLDTKAQSATRGTEKTYNPTIKLTRKAGEKLRTTIFYGYTKNSSLDKSSYDYDKQQYGFEINYLF